LARIARILTLLLVGFTLGCGGRAQLLEMAAAARSPSASWDYLGAAMADSAEIIESLAETELERREGYRMLARTLALGFDRMLEFADPSVPDFFRLQSAHRKFAGDNPDQLYHGAAIDGAHTYRIRGRWSGEGVTTRLIEISVYGGGLSFDDPNAKRRLVGHLDERELVIADDGTFEVTVGPGSHEGNSIRTSDDSQSLLVRRYFSRPQLVDELPLSIELVGEAPSRAPLDARGLAKGLIGSGAFLREVVKIWGGWYPDVRARLGANVLKPLEDDGSLLTPAGMTYLQGAWELAEDEALLVRFVPPDVPYWGFLPMNVWMESFDWRVAPVTRNGDSAVLAADGSVTLVLSEQDPGLPNWLATLGHRRGLMSLRLARLGEQPLPEVETRVVKTASLAGGQTR
jgi:hypothetical protein